MKACEDAYSYDRCRFITGEVFNIIPWLQVMNMMSGLVKKALASPGSALLIAGGLFCSLSCLKAPSSWANAQAWICDGLDMFNTFMSLKGDIEGIADAPGRFFIGKDFCDQITPFDKFLAQQTGVNATG
jgi:hypothetical protein